MLTQTLWWSCNALIAWLLLRSITGGFFRKYLVFYVYLAHVLILAFIRFSYYILRPHEYSNFYWYTEFISVAVGYCVIWEIYDQALATYPGTVRIASVLIWVIFIAVISRSVYSAFADPAWAIARTTGELERNLRIVQAALLGILVVILNYYMIRLGKNLRGVILGYGFFVGAFFVNATLRSRLGETFHPMWRYFQSASYLVTLLIWCATLSSYHPNPAPEPETDSERDYDLLSQQTAHALAKARGNVLKGVR